MRKTDPSSSDGGDSCGDGDGDGDGGGGDDADAAIQYSKLVSHYSMTCVPFTGTIWIETIQRIFLSHKSELYYMAY
jgi:hypothetical protein